MNKGFKGVKKSLLLTVVTGALAACQGAKFEGASGPQPPTVPEIRCQKESCLDSIIQAKQGKVLVLENGAELTVYESSGAPFIKIEGTFTDKSFAAIHEEVLRFKSYPSTDMALESELNKAVLNIETQSGARVTSVYSPVGYFTALMPLENQLFGALKRVTFQRHIVLSPVIIYPLSAQPAGLNGNTKNALGPNGALKTAEFVALANQTIGGGVVVDGSSVRVGVTDTGITLAHPAFSDANGNSRIKYMKDFTGEGAVYINPLAKFSAKADAANPSVVEVEGEVILTPKLPVKPTADKFNNAKAKIKVSGELKNILLGSPDKVRLGLFNEDSMSSKEERVDVNGNGKFDDKLLVIYVEDEKSPSVYFDFQNKGDFTQIKPLHNWNDTQETTDVHAEKIGVEISQGVLLDSTKQKVPVMTVAIVGFDPGQHGSHVAGIAAGNKIVTNLGTAGQGVAPNAEILMNRVCANNAGCSATEAIVDMAIHGKAHTINMSLGSLAVINDGNDVQEMIINRVTSLTNTLFMISAGNSGPGRQTVGSPSLARLALSIGATATPRMIQSQYQWPGTGASTDDLDANFMLFFSSRGPSASGSFKPNISAPGSELSAVPLNAGVGQHPGTDVFWGTSMAAPAATGAFALLLDAIQKYNQVHSAKLTTDVVRLRQVLIESAKPFDSQYTWIDQGTGMIDLVAAWKKVLELAKEGITSDIKKADGTSVEPDYTVMISAEKHPNGLAYDGSRVSGNGNPAFAEGLYLTPRGGETFKQVSILRALPEKYLSDKELGSLTRQLATTQDSFVLKTVYSGNKKDWLKAGVGNELPCENSEVRNLTIYGRGVEVAKEANGKGKLVPLNASTLNVCLDSRAISEFQPGDDGALIYAYKISQEGVVSSVASFIVPVYLNVPHKVLTGSTAYETTAQVKSFGVSRNYVEIPKGTRVVKVTLEVPKFKAGQGCSGVELMALEGINTARPITVRKDARVQNCSLEGVPTEDKLSLSFTRVNPNPGVWDLHVFGQYQYRNSQYKLRVDYLVVDTDKKAIEGKTDALNGSFNLTIREASQAALPQGDKSTYRLLGLEQTKLSSVKPKGHVNVETGLGVLHRYPNDVTAVTIKTSDSPGNDIDLTILACPKEVTDPDSPACMPVAASGGETDLESASFTPEEGVAYVIRVDGFTIGSNGSFKVTETLGLRPDSGQVMVEPGTQNSYAIKYSFSPEALTQSSSLNHALFKEGKYYAAGELVVRSAEGTALSSMEVKISN